MRLMIKVAGLVVLLIASGVAAAWAIGATPVEGVPLTAVGGIRYAGCTDPLGATVTSFGVAFECEATGTTGGTWLIEARKTKSGSLVIRKVQLPFQHPGFVDLVSSGRRLLILWSTAASSGVEVVSLLGSKDIVRSVELPPGYLIDASSACGGFALVDQASETVDLINYSGSTRWTASLSPTYLPTSTLESVGADGSRLVTLGNDNSNNSTHVWIIDCTGGRVRATALIPSKDDITALVPSPVAGETVLAIGSGGFCQIDGMNSLIGPCDRFSYDLPSRDRFAFVSGVSEDNFLIADVSNNVTYVAPWKGGESPTAVPETNRTLGVVGGDGCVVVYGNQAVGQSAGTNLSLYRSTPLCKSSV